LSNGFYRGKRQFWGLIVSMDFFDFFFPEEAQAASLRQLAETSQQQAMAQHRERFYRELERRAEDSRVSDLEHRVVQLERDITQAGFVIEALLQLLEESKTVSREAVAVRTGQIDGVRKAGKQERFTPKRKWNGPRDG
jgi:hypothetical protein